MTPSAVDTMLRDYKRCAARRDYLIEAIEILKRQKQHEQDKAMAEDALHSVVMNGMPHGSNPGNPVESLVLRYESGYKPQYIQEMDADLWQMQDELKEVTTVCNCVQAWLLALNDKESILIKAHVIEGLSWAETVPLLQRQYPGTFTGSRNGLRDLQRRALEKIYSVAQ